MAAPQEKEIGRIAVDDKSAIVIRLTEWRGKQGLDIRMHMDSDIYRGFTKQGIRIPLDRIDEVRAMLMKAKDEIKQKPGI